MTVRADDPYIHGHDESVVAEHAQRTAAEAAAFLLPLLKRGTRILDVGCGPGTITLGLAEAVAPGEVIGIDVSASVIERARNAAQAKGAANVTFRVGNIYEPDGDLGTFDVIYAHQVLQHLGHPVQALTRARELLRPLGFVGIREVDYSTRALWPPDSRLDRFYEIYYAVARRHGGEPDAGRRLRQWLLEAGFTELRITTSTWTFATPEATRRWGDSWATRAVESDLGAQAVAYGAATSSELEEIACAWREWGSKPDAFYSFTHVEGVGWKPR